MFFFFPFRVFSQNLSFIVDFLTDRLKKYFFTT